MELDSKNRRSFPSLASGMVMKFLSSNGECFKEKLLEFPPAKELESSELLVVCIDDDDRIVAACGVRSLFNILTLHVKEGYRGRRVGTQLLRKTIQAAKKRRLGFITLTVSSGNIVAFQLYCKFGFKELMSLRKSRQVLMLLPLTFTGKLAYAFFHMLCLLLPNTFLLYVHSWFYQRTLTASVSSKKN